MSKPNSYTRLENLVYSNKHLFVCVYLDNYINWSLPKVAVWAMDSGLLDGELLNGVLLKARLPNGEMPDAQMSYAEKL